MLATTEGDRPIVISREAWLLDLGRRAYREVWELQKALVDRRAEDRIPDGLILVEHDPVATLGRRGKREDVLDPNLEVFEVERGGEATFHGPGQLVVYPILKLPDRLEVKRLVTDLEELLLRTCADFGIDATREGPERGAWVGGPPGVPEDPTLRSRRGHHDLDGEAPRASRRHGGCEGVRHRALPGRLR